MQSRFFSFFSLAVLSALLFSSCSKTNKQGRYIPVNAGFVMSVNVASLNEKLPWEEVKQNEWFTKMSADTSVPPFAKLIMENPENSGVSLKNDILFFAVKDTGISYVALEGFVSDEAKFKKFITDANKKFVQSSKDGYTYYSDDKSSVGYNKDRFVFTVNTPQMSIMDKMPAMGDTSFGGMQQVQYNKNMNEVSASVLNLTEDKSLTKNERFTELVNTKGDAHFWYNAQYLNAMDAMKSLGAMASMVNLSKLYEGAVTAGTLNFEKGKIDVDLKSYGGKEITDLYKNYNGTDFDKTMIKNIPSQNVAGVFAFNFKPEGIKEFLKLLGMDGLANMGANQIGFGLDDFIKANKGDIMIAVTDIKTDSSEKGANFIFSAAINDKTSFNKIIDAGKKMGASGMMPGASSQYAYSTNDKYFVFSNNKPTAETYLSGSVKNSFGFLDKISGGPFGGYVNFQYVIGAMKPKPAADSLDVASYNATLKMWDNLLLSGGNFKDGGITQHWEINLMDKTTNSLKQLNNYAATMGNLEEKKKALRKVSGDETFVYPAPPAMIDTTSK
jgi:hypothetical protein